MNCAEKPCPTCPWRRSSTVGGADIPGFSIEDMRRPANTVPPRGTAQDGFLTIMACHHSKPGQEYACAGYIAQHGQSNINVRFMARAGTDLNKVLANCAGIDLYDNFYEMLDTFEAALAVQDNESFR
ncbi:DUF6283 family protein [Pseudomonas sp. NPDC089569]|uniref:DUF6283 family protein n=1 Tax=Pseudomonas sp. NPDC089569 TaxID=3390722 RepID=UPI003D05A85D